MSASTRWELAVALVIAVVLIAISPGLAIVALVALILIALCLASYGVDRVRAARSSRARVRPLTRRRR